MWRPQTSRVSQKEYLQLLRAEAAQVRGAHEGWPARMRLAIATSHGHSALGAGLRGSKNCYLGKKTLGGSMKRYLIFAALGPLLGGFCLLLATTLMSGYWNGANFAHVTKLLGVFVKTLQYSYLFGILPTLMIAAVDDILFHVKRIPPVGRMLIVGVIAFIATEMIYGSRGPDSGATQFILYGLVGFVPATVSSWLAHEAIDKPATA